MESAAENGSQPEEFGFRNLMIEDNETGRLWSIADLLKLASSFANTYNRTFTDVTGVKMPMTDGDSWAPPKPFATTIDIFFGVLWPVVKDPDEAHDFSGVPEVNALVKMPEFRAAVMAVRKNVEAGLAAIQDTVNVISSDDIGGTDDVIGGKRIERNTTDDLTFDF